MWLFDGKLGAEIIIPCGAGGVGFHDIFPDSIVTGSQFAVETCPVHIPSGFAVQRDFQRRLRNQVGIHQFGFQSTPQAIFKNQQFIALSRCQFTVDRAAGLGANQRTAGGGEIFHGQGNAPVTGSVRLFI